MRWIPERWRLAYKVLPFAIGAVAAEVVVRALGVDTITVNPLFTGLVAANVFLLGFLLAGTLADYKEAERLPGELATSLEAIADECEILYDDKGVRPARDCLAHVSRIAAAIRSWLGGRESTDQVLTRVRELNGFFLAFEAHTQPNFIVRLKQEQTALRRLVTRIHTIRDTSFVGAGYAIAELTSALLIGVLLFLDITPRAAALFLVFAITFLLVYMIALIRDLDDPFEYDNGRTGAAEVSLHPFEHLEEHIGERLRAMDSTVEVDRVDEAITEPR